MKRLLASFLLLIVSLPSQAQLSQIDSLERLLARTPADTNRVLLLNLLSYQYKNWGTDTNKTKGYAEQCLQLATQLNYSFGIGKGHHALGNYYYSGNQNQEARQQYEKALKYYQQDGRKRPLATISANLGMVTEDMGNYSKAMEYYLHSIRIAEEIGDKTLIGNNFSSIGVLMLSQKKYKESLGYLFRALAIQDSVKDYRSKTLSFNTIAVVYQELKQYDQALQYLNQSLHLSDSLHLERGKVNCYNNMGIVHFYLKHYDQALRYYHQAFLVGEPLGANQSMSISLAGMGDVCRLTNRTAEAIDYYQKSLKIAEANQLVKEKLTTYEGLTLAYAQLKAYDQAYFHQSKLLSLRDSMFSKENDRKIAQLEADYEVEKKQTQIELLQKDQERATVVRNAILSVLLAALVIIGLIINRQRLKNRQNRLLVEKSEEIARKNTQLEQQAVVMATQATELATTNDHLVRQSALLEQQTHQLQELDQVKSNFFTNISHEFRTPLTLILAPLEKLLKGEVEAGQARSFYQLIDRNARNLLQLINQLLDFSKLEAGSLKAAWVRGDVLQRLKSLTFSFVSLAESKRIRLEFCSDYRSIHARYDPDILDKILNNLLSNAFKFTPSEGHVTVTVALHKPADLGGNPTTETIHHMEISVKDTGIGIPASQLNRVFDRFFQVDGSQLREQEGTGIGLALVKELVAFQQGSLSVSSEVGRGSEFTVTLPLAECQAEAQEWVDPSEAVPPLRHAELADDADQPTLPAAELNEHSPLLLLVEDNQEVREFIRESFCDSFRVMEATNGEEGVYMAYKEIPDLVITDRMMPKMDGVALCRALKTDERTSHIPLIMLTAKASEESKIEGLETGADDYVYKPFSLQELTVRVRNLIEQRRRLRERFSREVKLQPKDIAITSADEVFLHKAIQLIETHMADTDFTVESFAHEIGMSRVHLHRKLKALTDQSTTEFIRSIRLKRAASLMEQQFGNVSEIMYEVGFNNVSYFASNFRKMFGVNPSEYNPFVARDAANSEEKKSPSIG